jgi:hypothetical protein
MSKTLRALGGVLTGLAIVTAVAPSAGAATLSSATHRATTAVVVVPSGPQVTTATHCPPPCWDPWYRCHHPYSCGDDDPAAA